MIAFWGVMIAFGVLMSRLFYFRRFLLTYHNDMIVKRAKSFENRSKDSKSISEAGKNAKRATVRQTTLYYCCERSTYLK